MKHILCVLAIFCGIHSFAQTFIKGRVYDQATQQPLAGATISYAGKAQVTTDKDGQFQIECGKINRISISYIGYETIQENIKDCNQDLRIGMMALTHKLNEVEITATSSASASLLAQPVSITTLHHTELKRATGLFLDDVINANVPGVTMQKRSISGGQQFNIRGYGNGSRGTAGISSNFDNQGSKVYLNGIPVTDAEGITVLDDIDYGSVDKVEISKGPAGSLYGLAIAGVVNLETIRPEKGKTSVSQEVTLGRYGLERYTTSFRMGKEHSAILLNYGHQEYSGFMIHTASQKDFVNFSGEFEPGEKQTLRTYFGYTKSYDQRAGESTIDQYINKTFTGNPAYLKNNAHSEVTGFRAGVSHEYKFNERFVLQNAVFGSSLPNDASSGGGWTDKLPVNYGFRSTLESKFATASGLSISGITGVEAQKQRAAVIGYAMIPDSNDLNGYNRIGAIRSDQFTVNQTASYFTEWTLGLQKSLSFTAGLGLSTMKIELNDRLYSASANRAPSQFVKSYDGMFSPHFALNKIFSNDFSVHLSYSTGYKAPVSSYFFIPAIGSSFARVNESLQPEKGEQYELGAKGSLLKDKLQFQLALFNAIFSKKMTAAIVPLNSTTTLYSYVVNGGRQDHKGAELELKYAAYQSGSSFFSSINPWMNFTYSDFKYRDFKFQRFKLPPNNKQDSTLDYSNKAVGGVAPLVFNIGVDVFTKPGFYLNTYYSYRDAVPITSDGLLHSKPYNIMNGKLGYKAALSKHFDIDAFVGATNLTGNQYYYMVFVNQLTDAYLPAPLQANYFGGVNLKYNF
jgi:iron complex outermembrane recepter protein